MNENHKLLVIALVAFPLLIWLGLLGMKNNEIINNMTLIEYNEHVISNLYYGKWYRKPDFSQRHTIAVCNLDCNIYSAPSFNARALGKAKVGDRFHLVSTKTFDSNNKLVSAYETSGRWFLCSFKTVNNNGTDSFVDDRYEQHRGWINGEKFNPQSVVAPRFQEKFNRLVTMSHEQFNFLVKLFFGVIPIFTLFLAVFESYGYPNNTLEKRFIKHDLSVLLITIVLSGVASSLVFLLAKQGEPHLALNSPFGDTFALNIFGATFFLFHSPVSWLSILRRPIGYRSLSKFNGHLWWGACKLVTICIPLFLGFAFAWDKLPSVVDDLMALFNLDQLPFSIGVFVYGLICSAINLFKK